MLLQTDYRINVERLDGYVFSAIAAISFERFILTFPSVTCQTCSRADYISARVRIDVYVYGKSGA